MYPLKPWPPLAALATAKASRYTTRQSRELIILTKNHKLKIDINQWNNILHWWSRFGAPEKTACFWIVVPSICAVMVKEVFTTEFWCRAIQNHNTNTVPSEKPSWRQHKFGLNYFHTVSAWREPTLALRTDMKGIQTHAMCQGKTTVVELLPREWHRSGPIAHRHTQNTCCHASVGPLLQHTVCRTLNFVRSSHHACARVAQTQTTPPL